MSNGAYSIFDGYSLTLYSADGRVVGSWPAISGRRGYQEPSLQGLVNLGPIPEGRYSFSIGAIQPIDTLRAAVGAISRYGRFPGGIAAWGTERAFLRPDSSTDTLGRSDFSIHGGYWPACSGRRNRIHPRRAACFRRLRREHR